jgi:hypothetical protein
MIAKIAVIAGIVGRVRQQFSILAITRFWQLQKSFSEVDS